MSKGLQGEKVCPRCKNPFEQRHGEKCPSCGVKLSFVRTGNKFRYEISEVELAKPLPIETRPELQSTSGLANNYPRTISFPGDDPMVIQTGPSSYEITYRVVMVNTMAYCPKCGRPAFQMSILKGEIEHQCTAFVKEIQGKCLTKTTYTFLSEHLPNK